MTVRWADTHGTLVREGFVGMTARSFVADPLKVFDNVGVYAILVRGGGPMLARAGYDADAHGRLWSIGDYDHIYTGESVGVRSRLLHHLQGRCRESNLRQTLLAMQSGHQCLWHANGEEASAVNPLEDRLTAWMAKHAMIAVKRCSYILDVEDDIMARAPTPLNIRGRGGHPFARSLSRMKLAYAAKSGPEASTGSTAPIDFIPFPLPKPSYSASACLDL